MNANIKILSIGLVSLILICCSSSPPPKDETQELIDEYDKLLEQQKKINEKAIKDFESALANLRKDCSVLREYKTFINDNWQTYKRDETDFLLQLNERQLELYSEWYDSLKGDNQPKQVLYTKKLANSLNEKQKASWGNLYIKLSQHVDWVSDFQKRSNDFENKKNALLNYVRVLFNDPQFFEIFKLNIERDLAH